MLPTITPLAVLYADETLLVIDKPAGLLAVPGRGEAGRDCLAARVQARFPDALVVHRLDMATSGLMLFSRSPLGQRSLSSAFAARRVHKRYVAVVEGLVTQDSGVIEAPLAADWPRRPRQMVDLQRGKPALTRWRVLARADDSTRLELEPVTGRSHQLRVHLQSIGHPILGDPLYSTQPQRSPRLLLHACRLAFTHPARDEECVFESPPPY
jgi:tRNA pseudouridine32 synthase/23S rRNA pseudouridine746 synthase